MVKRNRQRRPARRDSFLDPKPWILVVSEGEVTEPEYIQAFANAYRNRRVDVECVGGAGVPLSVVRKAKELKEAAEKRAQQDDENLRYDEVWCAFDRDQHPDFGNAKEMARQNGLKLAVSVPCIELWLLLHFTEPPGPQTHTDIQHRLRKHIPHYDKHVQYADYAAGYDQARNRAEQLDKLAEEVQESGRNPTTGFWRLTESIRSGA